MATASVVEPEVEPPLIEPSEHYEVVDGRIVEAPPLGTQGSCLASFLVEIAGPYARTNRLGRVVNETLFILRHSPRLRRRPDVAFVSVERWPFNQHVDRENGWDVIPDLAVEIVSPTDLIEDLTNKIHEYFEAGVRMVWLFYPRHREIYVYNSPNSILVLKEGDILDGGEVLPGFRYAVSTIFEPEAGDVTPVG